MKINKEFIDFLNKIEDARNELRCSKSGAFYRGHSNNNHVLVPSLLRNSFNHDIEHNLFVDSYSRGNKVLGYSRNSWEFLSIMQHFGIPTRLLDWSECLSVALFFAISDKYNEPEIWVINPFLLNTYSNYALPPRIVTVGLDELPDYKECFISIDNKMIWPFDKPLFLQIPWSDNRMANQKGFFTIHSNDIPLNVNCKEVVRRVPLSKNAIIGAKRFLEYSGVNEDLVFPDLEGFGRFLKKKYVT